jgi:uncharacterized protein YndB with AHSA1/START domain
MKTKDIHQSELFKASAAQLYEAITNASIHEEFTGDEATSDTRVGGAFTAFGGYISGEYISLIPNERIVQKWIAQEDAWPADHASIVEYHFIPQASGTLLEFTHTNVPEANADSIARGWAEFYWESLREYFGE